MEENMVMSAITDCFCIRMKPDGVDREDQFLKGSMSIGWPTEESLAGKSRTEIDGILRKKWPEMTNVAVTMVCNFVRLSVGSIALSPGCEFPQKIHFFKTTSSYIYNPDKRDDGNPHIIEAEHIITVPRDSLSENLRRALNAAKRTVTNFTKYRDEIQNFLRNKLEQRGAAAETNEAKAEAQAALRELLKSSNDEVRLKAALALLDK